jgi:hypothetical protein
LLKTKIINNTLNTKKERHVILYLFVTKYQIYSVQWTMMKFENPSKGIVAFIAVLHIIVIARPSIKCNNFVLQCTCLNLPLPVFAFTVFTVFRLLTDFVCLYNYEFGLSLCKIVRSSVILLLPLWKSSIGENTLGNKMYHIRWRKCQKYFYVTHWQKKLLTF